MKRIITICAALLITANVFLPQQASAQSPERMSYQAVIRNSSDALVTNTSIGMQISILQGSSSGTAVYVETQTPTSNANGLVSLEIGAGTVVSGTFSTIDWTNGPYFIKTETDLTGGATYTITGTSQLLSVPYALHAKTAESIIGTISETDPIFGASVASGITGTDTTNWNNKLDSYTETDSIFGASVASGITGTDTTNWNNKQDQLVAGTNISIVGNTISATGATGGGSSNDFYLGQDTLGGIVFYIYIGSDGNQHGLIVNKNESMAKWQYPSYTTTNATRSWDGVYNTGEMTGSPAATYVNGLTDGGFNDWYLPSIDELSLLWHNRFHANNALNAGSFTLLSNISIYWSSTEYNGTYAFLFTFNYGGPNFMKKTDTFRVRAVRAF
ncbi:MAG: DUF1566 domain-containing protein [Bacteroidota bacterium]|nr:DUF1566 domain-containing protein [Bacteroidota bacterium]